MGGVPGGKTGDGDTEASYVTGGKGQVGGGYKGAVEEGEGGGEECSLILSTFSSHLYAAFLSSLSSMALVAPRRMLNQGEFVAKT